MENKKQSWKTWGFWLCILVMFAAAFAMTKVEIGKEYTDFRTHSRWAVGEKLEPRFNKFYFYPVWHFCVRFINWLLPFGREFSAAFVTACFLGAAGALLYSFLWNANGRKWEVWKCVLLALSLLFVTALYMPWYNPQVYLGQSSPTIWHNPTNLAVKPLALLIFLCFVKIYRERETIGNGWIAGESALLLLSCFIKPSFLQGFLPAMVVFLLIELIPNRGNSFLFSLKLALMCVPSGIYFIVQYLAMFDSGENRSIELSPFEVIGLDAPNPLFSILLSVAFPLFVLVVLGIKRVFQDKALWLALLFYICSLLEFVLLVERPEVSAGHFEWALQLALLLLFVMTALRFYQTRWKQKAICVIGNLLFLYHVLSGLWYYIDLLLFSGWQC